MAGKLPGSAIESNTITVNQLAGSINDKSNAAYNQANAAYAQANAAYDKANTGSSSGGFSKSFLMSGL